MYRIQVLHAAIFAQKPDQAIRIGLGILNKFLDERKILHFGGIPDVKPWAVAIDNIGA